jgi:23S rRNA (cytidine1920-2'-O)/16S rRNA (cytidine1409-2'-O)-methyltransferase
LIVVGLITAYCPPSCRERSVIQVLTQMQTKIRLDQAVLSAKLADNDRQAVGLIMAGKVLVDDTPVTKAGALIKPHQSVRLRVEKRPTGLVGRGGLKLQHALDVFDTSPDGRICIDIGASTGGFTQCLLEHGARKVFAVDSAVGELDYRLRTDIRVVVVEGTSVSQLGQLTSDITFATCDLSFLSLRKAIPTLIQSCSGLRTIIALFKPHYEASSLGISIDNGAIDDEKRQALFSDFSAWLTAAIPDWAICDCTESPITGDRSNTNRELLIHLNNNQIAFR